MFLIIINVFVTPPCFVDSICLTFNICSRRKSKGAFSLRFSFPVFHIRHRIFVLEKQRPESGSASALASGRPITPDVRFRNNQTLTTSRNDRRRSSGLGSSPVRGHVVRGGVSYIPGGRTKIPFCWFRISIMRINNSRMLSECWGTLMMNDGNLHSPSPTPLQVRGLCFAPVTSPVPLFREFPRVISLSSDENISRNARNRLFLRDLKMSLLCNIFFRSLI